MSVLRNYCLTAARKLNVIAAIAIVLMMSLTCADVILRLFRRPVPGTYEMVSFLGTIVVSFALAHTSAEKGHVAVSLIVRLFPAKVQTIIESMIAVLGMILFGLIAWQSLLYGLSCQRAGEVSLTLQIPFYPVIYGVAFGSAAVCAVLLIDLINAITKLKTS
ncbi:TRAP transporter, DctQ-like membrane protein [Candidatus Vecturithrix granuli]|uniref:TRAP transporter, DctQ-like membrane protein n=1 Tax=Vecturithrix granuli TaxID=1499967 RepID=A0A081C0R4_VECG1|nr:TRAP transporter, DctQ-like membrane protein [Candidatus Vecturithrix granuli]